MTLEEAVSAACGSTPHARIPLYGGCVAQVYRLDFADRPPLVAKVAPPGSRGGGLAIEGYMLDYLARHSRLPVPAVRHVAEDLLLMDYVEHLGDRGAGRLQGDRAAAEEDAAEQLATLHALSAEAYGFPRDTVIGALPQPNPWNVRWCDFYRDQRLLVMGRIARESGRLPATTHRALERFCVRLEAFIDQPPAPGLVHGDVWAGNVLFAPVKTGDRVAAFIDPALYFADPEVEIAYIELLSTFGTAFHRRYQALRPLRPGYAEGRRDIYNLFPLLVHTQICGEPYAQMVQDILSRYG